MNEMTQIQTPEITSDLRTSPSIAALAEALSVAQGEMEMPDKDREVQVKTDKGSYSFRYATMDNIVATTRPALARNGLALIQPVVMVRNKAQVLTRLLHKSGEWIESTMDVLTMGERAKPQEFGSGLTYTRRYAYSAMLGIVTDDDDDGNSASGNVVQGRRDTPRGKAAAPAKPAAAIKPLSFIKGDGSIFYSKDPDDWKYGWISRAKAWVGMGEQDTLRNALKGNKATIESTREEYPELVTEVMAALKALLVVETQEPAPATAAKDAAPGPATNGVTLPPVPAGRPTVLMLSDKDGKEYSYASDVRSGRTLDELWLTGFSVALKRIAGPEDLNLWIDNNKKHVAVVKEHFPERAAEAKTLFDAHRAMMATSQTQAAK